MNEFFYIPFVMVVGNILYDIFYRRKVHLATDKAMLFIIENDNHRMTRENKNLLQNELLKYKSTIIYFDLIVIFMSFAIAIIYFIIANQSEKNNLTVGANLETFVACVFAVIFLLITYHEQFCANLKCKWVCNFIKTTFLELE